eukprot:TRINITY_DN89879_c0_g1_i1.p9 TRINITY_DN89879_c0_g1~~TRINITY_DN89879_c0_g1_i1.p9  ORF type:complete len:102 (+),score=14.33 TRINITY_DN89879_c0_g1_i1:497-802(+)
MINNALKEIKKKAPDAKVPTELPKEKVYCSMSIYKVLLLNNGEELQKQSLFAGVKKWNLDSCCEHFGISIEERIKHGALIDSKLCALLLLVILGQLRIEII